MAINLQPPEYNQFEVSLLGPGTGECIVVHLGANEWMVVDSCLSERRRPVALDYLESIGVDFECVKVIVLTHFHDDHIAGAYQLIESCSDAQVYVSGALTYEESISFVMAHSLTDVPVDKVKPSTHEIAKIMRSVGERHVNLVCENQVLYRRNGVVVHSLSPSNRAVTQSRLQFSQMFQDAQSSYRKLANKLNPNLCSVALHVCNGVDTILLGSDLEVSNDAHLGWGAVIRNVHKPDTLALLFKVPHHGSETGHLDDVVEKMLRMKPISILTAFDRSSLPRVTDLSRIKAYSDRLYFTSQPKVHPPSRSRQVEETLKAVAKSRRTIVKKMGHIQVRLLGGSVVVCLNEHAGEAA